MSTDRDPSMPPVAGAAVRRARAVLGGARAPIPPAAARGQAGAGGRADA